MNKKILGILFCTLLMVVTSGIAAQSINISQQNEQNKIPNIFLFMFNSPI